MGSRAIMGGRAENVRSYISGQFAQVAACVSRYTSNGTFAGRAGTTSGMGSSGVCRCITGGLVMGTGVFRCAGIIFFAAGCHGNGHQAAEHQNDAFLQMFHCASPFS